MGYSQYGPCIGHRLMSNWGHDSKSTDDTKLTYSNLPEKVEETRFKNWLNTHQPFKSFTFNNTSKSASVEYHTHKDAKHAMQYFNGRQLLTNRIIVCFESNELKWTPIDLPRKRSI